MADIRVKLKLNDGTYYEVDKSNGLKNLESLSQSTGQPKEAYYGVIASRGNCELNDVNGNLLNMIKENKLPSSNMEVKVFANGKQIQEHITTDSEYSNSQTLNLEMENWIYKLDTMMTSFYDGDYSSKTLQNIILLVINDLQTKLGKTITISNQLLSRASTIVYQYICLPVMTYRSLVDKICYANRMNLIETDDGNLTFVDADTTRSSGVVYSITPDMVIGDIKRDVIVKNKTQKVNYSLANLTVFNHQVFETSEVSPNINYSTTTMNVSSTYSYRNDPAGSVSARFKFDITRGEFYVLSGQFAIPKSSNIKGIDTYNFTVEGEKKTTINIPQDGYYGLSEDGIQSEWFHPLSPIGKIGVTFSNSSSINSPLTSFSKSYSNSDGGTMTAFAGAGGNTLTMQETSTSYVFYYNITVHQAVYHQRASHSLIDLLYTTLDVAEGESRDITKIIFNISGRKMILELNNDLLSYGDSNSPNEITIPSSELITTQDIGDRIASNIISDYGDGVMTAQLTIACVNVGNKDFSKGEVLQVGDYVRIDRDKLGNSKYVKNNGTPYVWKIVGRNFRYSGVPLIDLTLQELK